MNRPVRLLFALPCCAALLAACAPPAADPRVIEPGVRREVFVVEGPPPPPNPVTGGVTPPEASGARVVRYRVDTGTAPPKPARVIVVLMPGFLGGAGSFDALARALVRRSRGADVLEAWAIDRRSNGLEDRTGIEGALDAGDADVLTGYYFEGAAVGGRTFPGFKAQADVDFMSEWGVASTLEDLRAVLALVPAEQRKARLVLAGHSLGATLAAQYAAWDFEGTPGAEELAGLVLIDGVTGGEGQPLTTTQAQLETDGVPGPMGTVPSVSSIRTGARYFAFPIVEATLFPIGVGAALRAQLNPDLVEKDVPRARAFQTLFLMEKLPRFTNRGAFGVAFDQASCPVSIAAVNAGQATGGAMTVAAAPFGGGTVLKPTELTATYGWAEYDAVTPKEVTALDDFALAWARPGADFGEWYFPTRLVLEASIGASLTLEPTSWPVTAHGLKAVHGRALSAPVLVEAAGILGGDASRYDQLRALLPPVGPGRPFSGATRDGDDGYVRRQHPGFSHIDPLAAADVPGSEAAAWFDDLAAFALRHTPPGGVSVPVR
jgi:pimeloyl-ACP methyl ester carboxylesterase